MIKEKSFSHTTTIFRTMGFSINFHIQLISNGPLHSNIEESHVKILEEIAIVEGMKMTDVSEFINVERKANELINPF